MDNRIAKNYIYNLVYQVLIVIIPLVITPYLARVLGAEKLGIYDYCYSQCSLIVTFAFLGIGNYGNREIAYTKNDKHKMTITFKEIMCTQFLLGIVASIVFLIVYIWNPYKSYYLFFSLWIVANIVDCSWFFLGVEEMKYAVIKNIIAKVLFITGVFCLVRSSENLAMYILSFGGTMLFANLLCYKDLHKFMGKEVCKKLNYKHHILESFKLFLPTAMTQIMLSIDKLVLGSFGDNISLVSFYSNSEKIIQIPLALVTVMNVVMMPRLANTYKNGSDEQLEKYLQQSMRFSLLIALPIMFGILGVSDGLVPWFLGEEFLPCIDAIKLLSPIVLLSTLIGISGNQYFVATNQIRVLFIANTLSAIVNIVLDILFVRKFGLMGICTATVVAQVVSLFMQYYVFNKKIRVWKIIKPSIKYFLFSVVLYLFVFRLFYGQIPSITKTFIQIFVGICVYLVLLVLTKDTFFKGMIQLFIRKK